MNILDMLAKELAHLDFTLEEKARYLYIRCCQLFTYDPRYKYCNKIENGHILKKEILNKKINLEKVTDNWVVCTSHTTEVFIILLKLLLNIEAESKKTGSNSVHVWAEFDIGGKRMKADSALKFCPDLTRVKMGLETQEYYPIPENNKYKDVLTAMDKKIGYITDYYQSYYIEQLRLKLDEGLKFCSEDERLLYKWNIAIQKLKEFSNTIYPLNQQICLNYLILHLFTLEEQQKIKTSEYFQITADGNWCFANIYSLSFSNTTKYFIQPRFQNKYNFYEIDEDTKNYYNSRMQLA